MMNKITGTLLAIGAGSALMTGCGNNMRVTDNAEESRSNTTTAVTETTRRPRTTTAKRVTTEERMTETTNEPDIIDRAETAISDIGDDIEDGVRDILTDATKEIHPLD